MPDPTHDFSDPMIAAILAQAAQDPNSPLSHRVPAASATAPAPSGDRLANLVNGADVGAIAGDAATTLYGLSHGYHEADPMLSWAGPKGAVPVMLAFDAASYLLAHKLLGDAHPNLMKLFTAAQAANHGFAATHNLIAFQKQ
jgi:hypothetical protein